MIRPLLVALLFLLPVSVSAAPASLTVGNTVLVASSTVANLYLAGGTIAVTAPVGADLTAMGGSIVSEARVAGDVLLGGGALHIKAPVGGDLRVMGGRITVDAPVSNDFVAVGGSVIDRGGGARNVFVAAASASLLAGAEGPVTLYANDVELAGAFNGDVTITAGNRIVLAENTVIHGALNYQAPQEAIIPASAVIDEGVHYTGASYLPTAQEARAIALASFGVFLFVKILGALILAGLIAGLFPLLATRMAARAMNSSVRQALLTLLLGFAVLVATPALLVLLAVTFIGLGLALLLGALYFLLCMLSFVFAGIIMGAFLAKLLFKRTLLRWSDAILGTLVLFLFWYLPVIGWTIVSLLSIYALGALCVFFYRFAFPNEDPTV